jgi:hypothetical protein
MFLLIDTGLGQDVEVVKCQTVEPKGSMSLQIVGLTAAGGTIIFEQSVDGKNFAPVSIDGNDSFTTDDVYHILHDDYFLRANYDGASQNGIKIILR